MKIRTQLPSPDSSRTPEDSPSPRAVLTYFRNESQRPTPKSSRSPLSSSPQSSLSSKLFEELTNSSQKRLSSDDSSMNPASVSGLSLPLFMQSALKQLYAAKTGLKSAQSSPEIRSDRSSPKSRERTPRQSPHHTLKPSKIKWNDEELVVYGTEKNFSFSGYQLRLISLLGILYAASRILRLSFVARDFEL